jgi:hypothetical protein
MAYGADDSDSEELYDNDYSAPPEDALVFMMSDSERNLGRVVLQKKSTSDIDRYEFEMHSNYNNMEALKLEGLKADEIYVYMQLKGWPYPIEFEVDSATSEQIDMTTSYSFKGIQKKGNVWQHKIDVELNGSKLPQSVNVVLSKIAPPLNLQD